ncbi:MAG: hypothetical protein V3U31_05060, partial [Dehalococcoidia bacterium]
ITANEAPVPLPDSSKIILHLVPFRAFEAGVQFDLTSFSSPSRPELLFPIYANGYNGPQYNFDGVLTVSRDRNLPHAFSYLQIFRNGIIEAVDVSLLERTVDREPYIPSVAYEQALIEAVPRFLSVQQELGVDLPVALMLTLAGIRGYRMAVSSSMIRRGADVVVDRDLLLLPEAIVYDYSDNPKILLRPSFDAVWNATGWPQSINYNAEGDWAPRR